MPRLKYHPPHIVSGKGVEEMGIRNVQSADTGIFPFPVEKFTCIAIKDADEGERNVLLVTTDRHRVLIDPGNGRDTSMDPESITRGLLLDRLEAAGISPADVDVVTFSHADHDHIGGATDELGQPAFPNARYVLLRQEWEFWRSQPQRMHASDTYDEHYRQLARELPVQRLDQLGDKVEVVESNTEIVPGIRILAASGHTPGAAIIAVESDGKRLLYIGDLMYDPIDIADPAWYSVFDFDPAQAVATRRRVFNEVAQQKTLVMAYHLPFPGLGYIERNGAGWRWTSLQT